jgi:hypothetical protein
MVNMIGRIIHVVAIVAMLGLAYTVGKETGLVVGNKLGRAEGREDGLLDACQQSVVGLRNQAAMFGMSLRGNFRCRVSNGNAVMDFADDSGKFVITVNLKLESTK